MYAWGFDSTMTKHSDNKTRQSAWLDAVMTPLTTSVCILVYFDIFQKIAAGAAKSRYVRLKLSTPINSAIKLPN